ncbi:MAG TPA: RagB/SusD family nutrient uptake outer membrane protein [Saprospirales bacterium]|nr:RagB/SusD family nutrient uptake outer membrane protein [Saprospirales bacterium]
MKKELTKIKLILYISFTCIWLTSCKKFIDIPPPSYQLGSDKVFTSDGTATSAVTGIYSEMMLNQNQFSNSAITLYSGLYADEMTYYSSSDRDEFINSSLSQSSHPFLSTAFWSPAYRYIYAANICIEKLENATGISPVLRNRLLGESKFIRAFCFFYLTELFDGVPLTVTSDYKNNQNLGRSPYTEVLDQVIADLKEAKNLLPEQYAGTERIRPNKWAAASLLARTYLYSGKWQEAKRETDEILNSNLYRLSPLLNNVFLKGSNETIWQLQPVNPNWNTWEGKEILFETTIVPPTFILRESLVHSFETGDKRKDSWIASRIYMDDNVYYPYKYKVYGNNAPVTENYVVFRLAEIYLIRAEAKLNLKDYPGASEDINLIRTRAGLQNVNIPDEQALWEALIAERRHELFAEWGHRFFDLKRWMMVDGVMKALKPSTWDSFRARWPIPYNQINTNSNLLQNPGY